MNYEIVRHLWQEGENYRPLSKHLVRRIILDRLLPRPAPPITARTRGSSVQLHWERRVVSCHTTQGVHGHIPHGRQ